MERTNVVLQNVFTGFPSLGFVIKEQKNKYTWEVYHRRNVVLDNRHHRLRPEHSHFPAPP